MIFHQNGSTLTFWADDNTDWNVTGILANAINPFWIITLSLPLAWFWVKRAIPAGYKPRLVALLALGGMQGAFGWFMVRSGVTSGIMST